MLPAPAPLSDDDGLQELRTFFRATGHHLVSHFAGGRALRVWLDEARERWRLKDLPARLEKALTELNFPFDDGALAWEQTFAQAVTVARRRKRLPPDTTPLGKWIRTQLELMEKDAIEPEQRAARVKALAALLRGAPAGGANATRKPKKG